jgi:hypothetical protein
MPELALRPAQLAGALPSLARSGAGSPPLPRGAAGNDRSLEVEARRALLARPPVPSPEAPPLSDAGPGAKRRPSSPAARRPPVPQSLHPPLPRPPSSAAKSGARPPAPVQPSSRAEPLPQPVQPPPEWRRRAKSVPKSEATAARPPQPNALAQPSLQKQLDREFYSLLRRSLNFLRWRMPRIPNSVWRFIPGRRLLVAAGALAGLFFVVSHTPLNDLSHAAIRSVTRNVKARAAFQLIDDFTGDVSDHWDSAGLVSDKSGAARITGFALNRNTMALTGYRLDFDARIASRGLGWVIGAADEQNYYAFKLEDVSSRQGKKYRLVRYLVSGGEVAGAERVEVDVPVELNADDFNRISVRLRDNRIATFINGTGVDYWQAEEPPHGGIGFFTEGNETAFVRHVEISGNEDTWGLFLYGFLELIEDAKGFVEPVTARFGAAPPATPANPESKSQAADSASLAVVLQKAGSNR